MSTLSIDLFLGFRSVSFRHLNLFSPINFLIITVLLYTGIYKVLLKAYVQRDIDLLVLFALALVCPGLLLCLEFVEIAILENINPGLGMYEGAKK